MTEIQINPPVGLVLLSDTAAKEKAITTMLILSALSGTPFATACGTTVTYPAQDSQIPQKKASTKRHQSRPLKTERSH
jgi:hypothetical protein